jgi:ethanolamine utilization protein EutN
VKLARVRGEVVSTVKHPFLEGRLLLLCEFVSPQDEAEGGYTIAVDAVGAGFGDLVLILDEGNGARQILGGENGPVRAVIAGIVEEVYTQ